MTARAAAPEVEPLPFIRGGARRLQPHFTGGGMNIPAASTSIVITKPSGVIPGALMFVALLVTGGAAPTVVPTGWTAQGNQLVTGSDRVYLYTRFAGSNEPANWTWTFAASTTLKQVSGAYNYADSSQALSVTFNQDPSGTTQTIPAISPPTRYARLALLIRTGATLGATTPNVSWKKQVEGSGATIFEDVGLTDPHATQAVTIAGTDTGVTVSIGIGLPTPKLANAFETGDLTGFANSLSGGPAAPVVVTDPTQPGSGLNVCQFDVLSGQQRQELITGGVSNGASTTPYFFQPGDDIYFASEYWLSPDFPLLAPGDGFQSMHQWKTDTPVSATAAAVGLAAGGFNVATWITAAPGFPSFPVQSSEAHTLGPMLRGVWTKFVVRIKFSTDPVQSLVQVWMSYDRGPLNKVFDSNAKVAEVINGGAVETRPGWWPSFTGETAGSSGGTFRVGCFGGYEKIGLYRNPADPKDAHMLTGGTRWGSTLAEVGGF